MYKYVLRRLLLAVPVLLLSSLIVFGLMRVMPGDALTVLKLLSVHEEIHVFVADGELRTNHSFSLAGQRFLTLHYEIERL